MADLEKDSAAGEHNQHWTTTAEKSGTYEFKTGGKFVDRNIDLVIPELTSNDIVGRGSNIVSITSVNVTENPDTGVISLSGSHREPVGATVYSTTGGFADKGKMYNGDIPVTAQLSGVTLPSAIVDIAEGSIDDVTITEVSAGAKSSGKYAITSSDVEARCDVTMKATTEGYLSENKLFVGDVEGVARVNATLPAASASITLSGSATKPTVAKDATNTNVSTGTVSTTKPGSGYYVAVKGTAPATTPTSTKKLNTKGVLGDVASEVSVSGSVGATTGDDYYVPITSANVTKGTTTVNSSTKAVTRGTFDISEGYINGAAGDLGAATFKNTATSGKTYVDISNTASAPILKSGDYLYIDQGYTDYLKISLAKLVPDPDDPTVIGTSNDLLSGKILYDNDGNAVTGTIVTKTSDDITQDRAVIKVPSGYYATEASTTIPTFSISGYTINETAQANQTVTVGNKNGDYYPVSVSSLTGSTSVETGGYAGVGSHRSDDSDGGLIGRVAAASVTGSNKSATASASANAYASTSNLVSGTYTSTATTGYTYHVDTSASASVDTQTATKTVGEGYTKGETVTASVTGSSKSASAKTYLLDSVITNNTSGGTSSGIITSGKQIKIGKGYYPTDRYYTAQSFTQQGITGTLSTSIDDDRYTGPTLVDSKVAGTPYVAISGNGTMTQGNQYSGTATAKTQYMEVYAGTFSIS